MIHVEMEPPDSLPIDLFDRAARAALDLSGAPDPDLTIFLTGDQRIRSLNRDFLGIDAPTDVLAFPADEQDPETGRLYLGDIIVSLSRAAAQAEERGHAVEAELQLLVVHGVLHLLGHDHTSQGEKECMWSAQANILESLGLPAAIVHE